MPLVLAASMLLASPTVFPAHGQFTGLICITSSTTATSCPSSPPSLGPFVVGSTLSVGIFVQNSSPLAGWDVYVAANPSFLSPTSAALGNLVPSPSFTSICINGVATTGSCTQGTANGPGVVEVTTIEGSGSNVCNNPPPGPCSGSAFTITYKAVGAANSTSLFYPTATGCSQSSVSSPPDVCVLFTDSLGTKLPENIQGATVTTTPSTTADFSLVAASSSLSLRSGGSVSDTLTAASVNNFNGTVTLSNSMLPSGVSVNYAPNPVIMAPGGSVSSNMTVTVNLGAGTTFTFAVTGMSGSLSHSVTIAVAVTSSPPLTGLACITSPSTATSCPSGSPVLGPFPTGSNLTVGVFIQGSQAMAGFDIYVAVNNSLLQPLSASLGPLIAHPSFTSICVNGVVRVGFSCTLGTVNGPGVVEVTTIDSTGNNECGNVSPCSGLAFTITYRVVRATSGTGIIYPSSPNCRPSSVNGTSTCLLMTNNGGTTLPENIQGATVSTTGGTVSDFGLDAPSSILVQTGNTLSTTLIVTGLGNFTGSVRLTNSPVPSGVRVGFNPNPVMINAPGGSTTSIIGVTVPTSIAGGTSFTFTVTGASGSLSHSFSITVMVTSPPVVGLVCITSPSTATSCPSNQPLLGPFAPGSTFAVGVFIQGSVTMGGFDIYVRVNNTLLNPVSASLGTLITNPTLTDICINGAATTGSCTVNTANGPGIVEVTTIDGSGGNECAGFSPCSGLAFTITYSVVGSTFGTPMFYPSSAGCTPSSVFGTTTCVQVADALGNILPENVQGASVATASDFSLVAEASSLSIPAGSSASDTLTVNGIGTFTGSVALSNGSVPSGVAVVFAPNPATILSPGGAATSSMTVFVGGLGGTSFTIIVIGTSGSITHSLTVTVTVTPSPSFTGGQLHWTHHVGLSKSNGTQTWTAFVANPLSTSVNVVVRIVGSSAIDPSLTFDVTCGVTCVNTAGGVNNTPGLTPVSVAAGAKSFSFSFNQFIDPSFANAKISFTATLYWTTGTGFTAGGTKTGSFVVVP